ncbi:hypothetical protein, partial [Janthinobacterium sp.]|uniref:hypothetical protein n=1 Tax=Janthinobacterium sp. TaxID=1871054 RepID=UPI002605DB77
WLSACSFFSLVYFVIVKSIAPGQIRTPIAGGDNYFDRGGPHLIVPRWKPTCGNHFRKLALS